jgi:hypothetical protein
MSRTPSVTEGTAGPLRDRRWRVDVGSVPGHGARRELTATSVELAEVAVALDIEACQALEVICEVKASGRGRYRTSGKLLARITQLCTITLEPLEATIAEPLTAEFWPEAEIAAPNDETPIDPSVVDVPEPIRDGIIDVGQFAYEVLAAAIDPYPRKPGASFTWTDPLDSDGNAASPFAQLGKLKGK